jgi:hypothetical protein
MAKKGWGWVFVEPKPKSIGEAQKIVLEKSFQVIIEDFKERFIQEPNPDFGYTTDIYGKWYRHYFYFCQKMQYDHPDFRVREAEHKIARIECFANNTFNLSYFRHTGQWFEIAHALTLEACLEEIKTNPLFYP